MAKKPLSISASDIKGAIGNALKKNAAFKNVDVGNVAIGHLNPPIIGLILRDELANQSVSALQKLAADVARGIPAAKGAVPTAMTHDGHIIIGYIPPINISVLQG